MSVFPGKPGSVNSRLAERVFFMGQTSFLPPNHQNQSTQESINPNQWLGLILSLSATALLIEGVLVS